MADNSFSNELEPFGFIKSFVDPNDSYTFRRRTQSFDLISAKEKNIKLAKLYESRAVRLTEMERNEDKIINQHLNDFTEKLNEITIEDVSLIRSLFKKRIFTIFIDLELLSLFIKSMISIVRYPGMCLTK